MRTTSAIVATLFLVGVAACSGDDGGGASSEEPATSSTSTSTTAVAERCDDPDCLLPFPDDAWTVAADTPTGRRLALPVEGMPTNADDVPIAPDDVNRADGFSPGSSILVHVPGLDVERSGIAPSTDVGSSLDDDAPVVVLDVDSGERVPYFAELDARATDDDRRLLIIRPAVAFTEGHRIAVGLRDLVDADGAPVPDAAQEGREEVARELGDDNWWLAWDFTVASADSLSGRLRHIRDVAYDELGDGAPAFRVDDVTEEGGVRRVSGTYQVPLFLTSGEPGATFSLGDDGLPERGEGEFEARFICAVPVAPEEPATPAVYGHGLLGSAEEVEGLAAAASLANLAPCATDWVGMSRADLPTVSTALADLSGFGAIPDRLQQGHVNFSFLGRLLNSPEGFASDPAFQDAAGAPVFDVGGTVFIGNSQGGILGGAASSVSTEWQRVVLGVPGMNYSMLLTRSIDWDPFAAVFEEAYTDSVERVLALAIVQLLWDRGENQGYAQHLTADPFDGMEAKEVLLVEAFGDHQVANVSTEMLARTIGARVHRPVLGEGRTPDVEPAWGIETLDGDRRAPAMVVWDYGNPAPPTVNLAPREPEYGEDPHGAGTREPLVLIQAFTFLRTGVVEDVCSGAPCTSDVLTG